jgi:multicomponent Na+:H+ antiporter subunit E
MTDVSPPRHEPRSLARTALVRGFWFMALWLVLMPSIKPADLAVGLLVTIAATALSLHLLPPSAGRVRFGALLGFVPHFLWQSVVAGLDVARRALSPSMPLNPGFTLCRVGFPRGVARNEFAAITSLLPGSLPAGEEEDAIVYHCLDVTQPVAAQIAEEERRLSAALISGERDG